MTVRDLVLSHLDNPETAILFEDESYTYSEWIGESIAWAHALLDIREQGPFHVGVLSENTPSYLTALAGAAIAGASVVGINPTRQGHELERDVTHADCQVILAQADLAPMLDGLDLGRATGRIFDIAAGEWESKVASHRGKAAPEIDVGSEDPYLLLFTSGTTGHPKAAICTQGRLASIADKMSTTARLTDADVCYLVMPLFHSNALMAGWAPAVAAGATCALRRTFSASGFLPDIRKFGATFFNYVGKPLTYILATPESPDDANNTLRFVFGNEGAVHDLERFSERFGVPVMDSYGSTEGGVIVGRTPDTPHNALGRAAENVRILNSDTGAECAIAEFDDSGKLLNADAAVGEMVDLQSASTFEGYWNNPEADTERTHDGIYWSGDLAYRDADGFIYFAGRNYDWLRVDGENFAAAPVERILVRHPDIELAAVYAVPNSDVGDDVMAALIRRPGAEFDADGFAAFLATEADMGTKWVPRYVRWADDLPKTATMKIVKKQLRAERWEAADEIWVRDGATYRELAAADVTHIRQAFVDRERESVLDA
jgi:fatty-acyl-CoA synthase